MVEKYMIGDVFGNMYCKKDDTFLTNRGDIFNSKELINHELDAMKKSCKYHDWELKLWTLTQVNE